MSDEAVRREPSSITSIHDLAVGDTASCVAEVSPDTIRRFAELSGDGAPLHTDVDFARAQGFDGCLVHGALLNAFVSRLVGTILPGPNTILQKMELSFHAPCYAPATLTITGRVRMVSEAVNSLVMDVTVTDGENRTLAKGKTSHQMLK